MVFMRNLHEIHKARVDRRDPLPDGFFSNVREFITMYGAYRREDPNTTLAGAVVMFSARSIKTHVGRCIFARIRKLC